MANRKSGILLHITSLPGDEGIGTLGNEAYRFVDFLRETNQKLWQILPLGHSGGGNSPYQCYSAFAGNPLLIDLNLLANESLLPAQQVEKKPVFSKRKTDFTKVEEWKMPLLKTSFSIFKEKVFERYKNEYWHFLDEHSWWLSDYAFFMAARKHFGDMHWQNWSREVKFREEAAIHNLTEQLSNEIEFLKYLQFLFFRQWHQLKAYANQHGIEIIGDVPLYVSGNSSDVWANTNIFRLDEHLVPTEIGGVPPDYFSETGQLWGTPVFDWNRLKARNYDWWVARLHFNLRLFNLVRIDHFRGLESFWAVPANEKTAINGYWLPAHGRQLLNMLKGQIGHLPFIAENLGIITPEVEKLRAEFELPGMKVLQFAFTSDATNTDLPHNYGKNEVVYTGTHDNNTTYGWLESLKGKEKKNVQYYLQKPLGENPDAVVTMAMASVANTCILPMQDILGLGSDSRMNTPGTPKGNWEWRFEWKQLETNQKKRLKTLTIRYNR